MRGKRRAFSFVELIFVMAIIGILAVLAVPRFSSSIAYQRAEMTARRVAADLTLARQQAVATSTAQTIKFDVAADQYTLVGMDSLDRAADTYLVKLQDEPYEATLVSVDFSGDADVVFDGYGVPDSGGTVVIQAGGEVRTITLDADTGTASVQ